MTKDYKEYFITNRSEKRQKFYNGRFDLNMPQAEIYKTAVDYALCSFQNGLAAKSILPEILPPLKGFKNEKNYNDPVQS